MSGFKRRPTRTCGWSIVSPAVSIAARRRSAARPRANPMSQQAALAIGPKPRKLAVEPSVFAPQQENFLLYETSSPENTYCEGRHDAGFVLRRRLFDEDLAHSRRFCRVHRFSFTGIRRHDGVHRR